MEKVIINEQTLRKIIRETVRRAVLDEGLFGPFNLGKKGKPSKWAIKDMENGKRYRVKPEGHFYTQKPEITRGDKKDGTDDTVTYKNFKGETVVLSYNRRDGFLCSVGEPVETKSVPYLDMLYYCKHGDWKCDGVNTEVMQRYGEDYYKISRFNKTRPLEDFEYNRDEIAVADPRLALGIFSWCVKVCKDKKHIQFLKRYIVDNGIENDDFKSAAHFFYHE